MSTASPGLSNENDVLPKEGSSHDCLLPKELVIMLLVVSGALAISFCLLLGYMCRYRIDILANRCCRSCAKPPSPPPRRSIAYVAPRESSWDDAPEATFQKTLTVTLRDERPGLTEERIRLSFSIRADALPPVRATGRLQRPGANAPSADPGAAMGLGRQPVALSFDEAPEERTHDPAYVMPSPSIPSLSSPQTLRFFDSTTAIPSTSNDQRRIQQRERSRTRSEGHDIT